MEKITLEDVKDFYNKYYFPKNTTIVIISQKGFKEVIDLVNKYFSGWNNIGYKIPLKESEKAEGKTYKDKRHGINTAKVLITYNISALSHEEIKALKVLNQYIGEGVNSLLFDSLRTKKGLVYDVLTRISNESSIDYIKLLSVLQKKKYKKQ